MNQMRRSVEIDPADLQTATSRRGTLAGIEIIDGLAPDDIPQQVTVVCRDGKCIIYFNYPSHYSEPRFESVHSAGHAVGVVGGNSGRLYEMIFPAEKPESVSGEFQSVIDSLTKNDRFASRRRHYEVAAEAVSDNLKDLFSGWLPGVTGIGK